MARWLDDITIQNHVQRNAAGTGVLMGTTGGHVWDAAKHLVAFFETERHEVGLALPGVKIIELGAGCGYLGMTVSGHMQASRSQVPGRTECNAGRRGTKIPENSTTLVTNEDSGEGEGGGNTARAKGKV